MTYVYIRCPHCNTFIRQTTDGTYEWGSPLRQCRKCNRRYIDSHYHEVAIEGFSNTDNIRSSWWMLMIPIVFSVILSIAFPVGFLLTFGLVALMVCGLNSQFKKNKEDMEEEMKRSKERLSNYNYALLLKDAGYNVPDEYLVPPINTAKQNTEK